MDNGESLHELMKKVENWLISKGHNTLVMDTSLCPRCEELRKQKEAERNNSDSSS